MKSKLIQIPYTIGIIKPHLVLREAQVSSIIISSNIYFNVPRWIKYMTSSEKITLKSSTRSRKSLPEKKF